MNKPMKEKTKLDKLFEDFDGDPKDYKTSIDWGEPVGKELDSEAIYGKSKGDGTRLKRKY